MSGGWLLRVFVVFFTFQCTLENTTKERTGNGDSRKRVLHVLTVGPKHWLPAFGSANFRMRMCNTRFTLLPARPNREIVTKIDCCAAVVMQGRSPARVRVDILRGNNVHPCFSDRVRVKVFRKGLFGMDKQQERPPGHRTQGGFQVC